MDLDRRLIVIRGREDFGATGWDSCIALDELGHHTALGLDTERQRGDVEEQHVLHVATQHTGLDRSPDGDNFVRVHGAVRFFTGERLHEILDGRHTGRSTDEDHVVDLSLRQTCIGDRLLERLAATLDQVSGHLLELRTRERFVQVQRSIGRCGDEWQVDLCLLRL